MRLLIGLALALILTIGTISSLYSRDSLPFSCTSILGSAQSDLPESHTSSPGGEIAKEGWKKETRKPFGRWLDQSETILVRIIDYVQENRKSREFQSALSDLLEDLFCDKDEVDTRDDMYEPRDRDRHRPYSQSG